MKRILLFLQCAGFVITVLGGILLHFLYGLTNESIFVASFSAVNETTWEHMKLIYFPLFCLCADTKQVFQGIQQLWEYETGWNYNWACVDTCNVLLL